MPPLKPRISAAPLEAPQLLTYALKLLAGRALSTSELRDRLLRRAANPEDIPEVLERLRQYGYLDDERFAELFAAARRDSGGFGSARVARDLRQRRIAPALAEKAARDAYQAADEVALVEQWLERKYRNVALADYLQEEKHLASAYRKLRYAGFSSSTVIRVLKRYAERAAQLEDSEPEA